MRPRHYLRLGFDPLESAMRFRTKADAVAHYREVATELDRYGQQIEATIHLALNRDDLAEYPDYALSLGPRGGVRCEPCF